MPSDILVIEDNPANLELIRYLLEAHGHQVRAAAGGVEGLEQARRRPPDVVLLDLQMPGMDGPEVLRRLRSDPALAGVPVVAVTALAMAGDRERILAMGFDGYIAKPLDPDRFVSEVETHAGHAVTPLADRAAHDAASVAGGRRSAGSAAGVRVLALDDAPINVGFLRSLLEPFGYVVTHASGVGEALVAARSSVPDLIISDVHLEGETGFDFIQQVREDATLRSVPFIFLSSTAWNAADRKRGIALGAARFLVRPIEPAVLLREIEDVLAGRGAAS